MRLLSVPTMLKLAWNFPAKISFGKKLDFLDRVLDLQQLLGPHRSGMLLPDCQPSPAFTALAEFTIDSSGSIAL